MNDEDVGRALADRLRRWIGSNASAWVSSDRQGAQPLSMSDPRVRSLALSLAVLAPLVIFLFVGFLPLSVDWIGHFSEVAHRPLDPFSVRSFFNPPWFALPLVIYGWLPVRLGMAVNAFLNLAVTALVVVRYRGTPRSLLVALTSFPFASLLLNGNVEWIPMMAFLVPPGIGTVLLLTKPQTGILAAGIWFKRTDDRLRLLVPSVATLLLSFFVWPNWPSLALANIATSVPTPLEGPANVSLWPWTVIPGIALLVVAWKRSKEIPAVAATLCLSPYFVAHSATLLMALVSARSTKFAALLSGLLWLGAIAGNWSLLMR